MKLLQQYVKTHTHGGGYFVRGLTEPSQLYAAFPKTAYECRKFEQKKIGIAEIRTLKEQASRASSQEKHQVFFLPAAHLTQQAKTALLKLVEEPPPRTHLVLYGHSPDALTPTLRSRLMAIPFSATKQEKADHSHAMTFLHSRSDPAQRKNILKNFETLQDIQIFLTQIESVVRSSDDTFTEAEQKRIRMHIGTLHRIAAMPAVSQTLLKDYLLVLL